MNKSGKHWRTRGRIKRHKYENLEHPYPMFFNTNNRASLLHTYQTCNYRIQRLSPIKEWSDSDRRAPIRSLRAREPCESMKRLKSRKNTVTDRVQLISIECQLPATPARHTNVLRRIRTKVSSDASRAEEERPPVYRFRFPRRQRSIHFSSILPYPLSPFISVFSAASSLSPFLLPLPFRRVARASR